MSQHCHSHTVEKFGGTSMVDTDALLENVLSGGRSGDDLYNRIIVVSAYSGITNALLEHKKTGEPGVYAMFTSATSDWAWGDALSGLLGKMTALNADILDDSHDRETADRFVRDRVEGVRSCLMDLQRLCSYGHFRLDEHLMSVREMLSALGEAQSAYNTVLALRRRGVNARFVDLTGWREDDHPSLDEHIDRKLGEVDLARELAIVTGYANCRDALVKTYDRGYTEVTMSRIAVRTGAREAIIHKEFHLSSADPRIVGNDAVRTLKQTNYDVADQLSNMGMEAIHPSAAKGLRQAGIPLRIKNTFEPNDPGAMIGEDLAAVTPAVEIVTGLRDVFAFEFFEQDMVGVKGYDAAILEALKRHKVRIVAKTSNANTITHFLEGAMKAVKRVEVDLSERFPSGAIQTRKVAFVSVIGRDLSVPGLAAKALGCLKAAGIEPLGMNALTRKVDLQVIVDSDAYADAIRALHRGLIEDAVVAEGTTQAADTAGSVSFAA